MTVTEPTARPWLGSPWTVEDLLDVPDDGLRHELFDGVLQVSPAPDLFHVSTAANLDELLKRAAPPDLFVASAGAGVFVNDNTYYIPDVLVFRRSVIGRGVRGVKPADVMLAIEVLSPSNSRQDLVLKRYEYARAGIPLYWIVDPDKRTLTVLTREQDAYVESALVRAGERFTTEEPFAVEFDPGEIC
ncbi:MAG: hypothetical protein V7603_6093 [Micromonosporaceae bacterium]